MKSTLIKTRHFRLSEEIESKLLAICSSTRKQPSAAIRKLIEDYPSCNETATVGSEFGSNLLQGA